MAASNLSWTILFSFVSASWSNAKAPAKSEPGWNKKSSRWKLKLYVVLTLLSPCVGWVFLMKSKSWRVHYWCNNALRDCQSNQVWQCQSGKPKKEICQNVCCMFRVFVLLIKPAAFSFPQFHYCCGCLKLASSIILSHRQAKLHQCKDLYINGLTLDITVKTDV